MPTWKNLRVFLNGQPVSLVTKFTPIGFNLEENLSFKHPSYPKQKI